MAHCEDFPACGHEHGCCPDFDGAGNQLNMICVCGAVLPITSRYSICQSCMNEGDDDFDQFDDDRDFDDDDDREPNEDMDGDFDSGMASAGHGTDEDYNHYEYDEPMGDW